MVNIYDVSVYDEATYDSGVINVNGMTTVAFWIKLEPQATTEGLVYLNTTNAITFRITDMYGTTNDWYKQKGDFYRDNEWQYFTFPLATPNITTGTIDLRVISNVKLTIKPSESNTIPFKAKVNYMTASIHDNVGIHTLGDRRSTTYSTTVVI